MFNDTVNWPHPSLEEQLNLAVKYHPSININCGQLRRIGKTETIKKMIRDLMEKQPTSRVYVYVCNLHTGKTCYSDLKKEGLIQDYFSNVRNLRGQANAVVFSDEVPFAEDELEPFIRHGFVEYKGGFYSKG